MKPVFKTILVLLSCLLVFCALPISGSAASEKAILSQGVAVVGAGMDVAVSGMVGNDIPFSADDFEKGMNLSEVRYLTFRSVPSSAEGELLLGSSRIGAGQSVSAATLSAVSFHPANEAVMRASFTFTVNGGNLPVTCNLSYRTKANSAPGVGVASTLSLNGMTFRDVDQYGTLCAVDPDGDDLRYEIVTFPHKGSVLLTDAQKGTYVYRPSKGYVGSDSFSYVARDSYGNYSCTEKVNLRVEVAGTSIQYVDISKEQAVASIAVTSAGVMSGVQVGGKYYFRPQEEVSRIDFLTMAMNAVGISEVPDCERTTFADDDQIPATMKGVVAAAEKLEILSAFANDENPDCFAPQKPVTRAEAAVILEKLLQAQPVPQSIPTFSDTLQIPVWAQDAVLTLGSLGIMTSTDGNVSPLANLTRGMAAELLSAVMRYSA
ncbi:MAG: hypothetical protein E7680_06195 [Ruminococcaceae bacterium]|nr:hypothetical protein [Oscillospiraceae bacterium]